ncbi:MAG: leucine-rich repeat domain-containing protein [Ruminiclostridium sp.]|nr:leucine-rich repeat domain-containing protein [Ruminiclostridium sp.]
MKTKRKKYGLRIDLILLTAFLTLFIMPEPVFSLYEGREASIQSGNWKYYDRGDHAIICGYYGEEEHLIIPSEIDGKPVTELCFNSDSYYSYYDLNARSAFFDTFGDLVTTELTIPDTVKRIGEGTFNNCYSFQKVNLPEGLGVIEKWAFSGCSALSEVNIPPTVQNIGESAFQCTEIEKLVIPDSVNYIGASAFFNCNELTSVKLSENLTEIPPRLFAGCFQLESAIIPDTVRTIGKDAFDNCNSLTSVKLPTGITEIPPSLFLGCNNLKSVEIPEGVQVIGENAFAYCGLEEIHFPKTLKSAISIFRNNPLLKTVSFDLDKETAEAIMGQEPFKNMTMYDYDQDYSSVQIIYAEKDTEPAPEPVHAEKTAAEKTRDLLTITSVVFASLFLITICMLIIQKSARKPKKAEQGGNLLTKYAADTVICPHCGTSEGKEASYCTNCGKKLPKKKSKK